MNVEKERKKATPASRSSSRCLSSDRVGALAQRPRALNVAKRVNHTGQGAQILDEAAVLRAECMLVHRKRALEQRQGGAMIALKLQSATKVEEGPANM